jgi:hypothetical protein
MTEWGGTMRYKALSATAWWRKGTTLGRSYRKIIILIFAVASVLGGRLTEWCGTIWCKALSATEWWRKGTTLGRSYRKICITSVAVALVFWGGMLLRYRMHFPPRAVRCAACSAGPSAPLKRARVLELELGSLSL